MRLKLAALLLLALCSTASASEEISSRYFYHGDGRLNLVSRRGDLRFNGVYRRPDGSYDEEAMRRINRIFGGRMEDPASGISPRLIEFIDFLQDRFDPEALITITSGFRSPSYNTNLRNDGRLAARASLHQYGKAADLSMSGVSSERIWKFVRELGFGGAGYYRGRNVHVDVGPARWWDHNTTGVGTGISDDNKLIGIVSDRDIYLSGEPIRLGFIRMTSFPIAVRRSFSLEGLDRRGRWKTVERFEPSFGADADGDCPRFSEIAAMRAFDWRLPEATAPGRYRVRAELCEPPHPETPQTIWTPEFEVKAR